ncbi:F-box protein CPR1-like [Impatiens glandulifera]|uniref:F-box protein CPR1-like n=1 Tax=Impatiens glandulifera TaxID=253017 RepID=UPI001FB124A7|nr:F-box protein CPR1-like [Impatiens glandulifera]
MSLLPDDILPDILSRLPVKSLLRFRCVSKFWLALISCPDFVKLHLSRSVQIKNNLRLFLWEDNFYRVDFDPDEGVLQPAVVNNHPLNSCPVMTLIMELCHGNYDCGIMLYGSCDGLLCMSDANSIDDFFICNPSTRKSKKLPYESVELPDINNIFYDCIYRFGYDNTNDDYKVVRLAFRQKTFRGDIDEYEVKVYSLKSNSWHRPEKFSQCPKMGSFGDSIAGGALHWISYVKTATPKKRLIVAFDLGTEKYRVIPQPKYAGPHFFLYLDNLGGCLSLSCQYESSVVEVFLLKEYGGENEHWSKLITISPTNPFVIFYTVKPITYSKCGKKVLLNINSSLIWYNLEQQSFEEVRVRGMEDIKYKLALRVSSLSIFHQLCVSHIKNHREEEK